jgi:uncharacterized protein YndB with AHSA1/START domain
MAAKNDHVKDYEGFELTLKRVFGAPRAAVYRAWIDKEQLARWWGPKGFTSKVLAWDARPGGSIRVDMRAPDGTVYPMGGGFREVVEPERIVFTSTALDGAGIPMFENLNVVTFVEKGAGTELTVSVRVLKAGPEAAQYLSGMEMGWSLSLERLGDEVARGK